MASSGGSGLDDLLSGVAQFNKPRMADMKKQAGTSLQASSASGPRSPAPAATANRTPPRSAVPGAAPVGAPAADPFSLDQLDHLVKSRSSPSLAAQRGASSSASSSSLGGTGGSGRPSVAAAAAAPSPAPSAGSSGGAFEDLLGGLGAGTRGGACMRKPSVTAGGVGVPAAAAAAAAPAAEAFMPPLAAPAGPATAPAAPFLPVPDSTGPPPVVDEDPFALFGGPPPSAAAAAWPSGGQGGAAAAIPVANVDDDFLGAFAAAPQPQAAPAQPPSQQRQNQQQPAPVAPAPQAGADHHDFGDFLGSEDQEAPAAAPAAAPASAAPQPEPARSNGSFGGAPAAAGPTGSFGFERRPPSAAGGSPAAAAGQPRYRVFDFVDAEPDGSPVAAGTATAAAAAAVEASRSLPSSQGPLYEGMRAGAGSRGGSSRGGSGSVHAGDAHTAGRQQQQQQHQGRPSVGSTGTGVLHADTYAQQQQAGGTKEVVADLGHKAAKALQSGTKWFMKASKTLVSQVQQRLDHAPAAAGGHQGGGGAPAAASPAAARHPGDPAPFHYDWAAQLSRVSPGSRSAALGAMAEVDRLAVQRVLDESMLGDSFMEGPEYDGYASSGGWQQGTAAAAAVGAQRAGSLPSVGGARAGSAAGLSRNSSRSSLASGAGAAAAAEAPPAYDQLFGREEESAPAAAPQQRQQRATSPSAAPAPAAAAAGEDLLGMGGSSSSSAGPSSRSKVAAAPAPAAGRDADFLGFSDAPAAAGAGASAAAPPSSSGTAHIDDLFTVPSRPAGGSASSSRAGSAAGAAAAAPPRRPAAAATAPSSGSSRPASGLDSMIDLGGDLPAVDTAGFGQLYQDGGQGAANDEGPADEPEVRRALRQKRIQEKHERMMRQLAEKRARDDVEEAEKSGKVELRDTLKPKIDAWCAGKAGNIRALLSSLHTVLWEGSGWVAPSMADMLDNSKVKRVYMKANLVVHPDKVKQKGGTLEQVTTADMVFDVLKAAWGKFEAAGGR